MSHNDVYKWFELYFPLYAGEKVSAWFQNGKNSIRVRQTNGQEFILPIGPKRIGGLKPLTVTSKRR